MPSIPVTIDTSDDVDFDSYQNPATTATSTSNGNKYTNPNQRNLLLAPPSVAAHEEKLRDLFTTFDRSTTDLQMLDRLSAGFVTLPPSTYDLVLVLTDANGSQHAQSLQLLSRDVYAALVPAMKPGARLQFQDGRLGSSEAREAILAGLVEKDGAFEKVREEEAVVPLRFGGKKNKKKEGGVQQNGVAANIAKPLNLGDFNVNEGDELIDEDTLLSEEDLKRPLEQPPTCAPEPGQKKRRRPCKDCTCGLAERLDAEDQAREAKATEDLNILKLKSDELNDEVDFTVQGKTGSCNSCSLGDAFRCASCPYIGLPPFKPGEEVKILNDMAQL